MNVNTITFKSRKYGKKCGNSGHVYIPKSMIGKRILSITYYDEKAEAVMDGLNNQTPRSPENDS